MTEIAKIKLGKATATIEAVGSESNPKFVVKIDGPDGERFESNKMVSEKVARRWTKDMGVLLEYTPRPEKAKKKVAKKKAAKKSTERG